MGVVTLELMLPCEGCCELRKRGLARSVLRPCSASRLRVTALFGAGALCGPTRAWSRSTVPRPVVAEGRPQG